MMKTLLTMMAPKKLCLLALGLILISPAARAGLTLQLTLWNVHYGDSQYYFLSSDLTTNDTPPNISVGDYYLASPQSPSNGLAILYRLDSTNGFHFVSGNGGWVYPDFASFLQGLTQTNWSIFVTNATTTNVYNFSVNTGGVSSNSFPPVSISFPTNGAVNVTNQPLFTWQGPSNYTALSVFAGDIDSIFSENAALPPAQTSWPGTGVLLNGTNYFTVNYNSNSTAVVVASVPRDDSSNAISGWVSASQLIDYATLQFFVGLPGIPSVGHTNVAHYTFDDNDIFATDVSGHGNNVSTISGFGSGNASTTNDALAGPYAANFDNNGGSGAGWLNAPTNLLATFAGSFTVSLWLKTSEVHGNNDDGEFSAEGIVSALNGDTDTAVMPMGLTGSKLAFYTGGASHDILHSQADINTGLYVHLVVTRDQGTGEKRIYFNGALDSSVFAATGMLTGPDALDIGYNNGAGFNGRMDDIQFYSGVLSPSEVAYLYNNPGSNVVDTTATPSGAHTNVAHYRFDLGNPLEHDDSGNGNDFNGGSSWGTPVHSQDTNAIAGSAAVLFAGVSSMTMTPPSDAFSNITSVLADTFSLSLWVQTSDSVGVDTDNAIDGATIVWAYNDLGNTNDIVPVALTGAKAAFTTRDELGNIDTLHSTNDVNDGFYHHIVVTRNRGTGEKKIYVDGVLEGTQTATTNLLNGNNYYFSLGGTTYSSYSGLVDDVQLYSGVLSASEVAYLHNNPGAQVADSTGGVPPTNNIEATFLLNIVRDQNLTLGDVYYCFPSFTAISPSPITTHEIHSPSDKFAGELLSSRSDNLTSLDSLVSECTNGQWTIYVNKNDPSEQQFKFSVSITGLTTNLLQKVTILSPANGNTNVPSIPTYYWSGPATFEGIFANVSRTNSSIGTTNLPGTATNWVFTTALSTGTNQFYLNYFTNDVPNITIGAPVDGNSVPLYSWSAQANLNSEATSEFVVSAPMPVQLVNPQRSGNNLQFAFTAAAGRPYIVEARTNLSSGVWIVLTNITGDGTLTQFTFPTTNPPIRFFRVRSD
ncbi:MAG: LamG domain-containing protein [Verrucomicrobia bacterium]|nr:LamG domain-containing protein [Verrucomicrobiota bacterium]